MNIKAYDSICASLIERATSIKQKKRPAYTAADEDVLINFKSVAKKAGITPMQAWLVYFLKHIDAISSQAKDPTIPQAEPIIDRFADAINYLYLGYALYDDTQGEPFLD